MAPSAKREPSDIRWCTCSICVRSGSFRPHGLTQRPQYGAWQTPATEQEHRNADERRTVLNATLATVAPKPQIRARDVVRNMVSHPIEEPGHSDPDRDLVNGQRMGSTGIHIPESVASRVHNMRLRLSKMLSTIDININSFNSRPMQLQFHDSPKSLTEPVPSIRPTKSTSPNNDFLKHREWLEQMIRTTSALDTLGDNALGGQQLGMIRRLRTELDSLDTRVETQWKSMQFQAAFDNAKSGLPCPAVTVATSQWLPRPLPAQSFIYISLMIVVLLETLGGVSREYLRAILATFRAAFTGLFIYREYKTGVSATLEEKLALQDLPRDPRTARQKLDIDPEFVRYACCPECFSLYPEESCPTQCTYTKFRGGTMCNSELLFPSQDRSTKSGTPRKVFAYQTLQSWLGRLMTRPGIEEHLDAAWDNTSNDSDIWGAPAIREFVGPDGRPFSVRQHGTYHLIFSLFIDWFNPYGNKAAGRSYSTGVIYMVCLNLPPHLRFQLENVYLVGVIPGPTEPSLQELNHLLKPLVDALLLLWNVGFFLTQTYRHELGRLVKGAVIPLVCDLPAARKAAGFLGHSANLFCSFCSLPKKHINNVNPDEWGTKHSFKDHLKYATLWRDACNQRERDKIEESHGIRWSELLRLPYWNPLKYTLLDSMHNIFLGELQRHCRNIWQINIKEKRSKTQPKTRTPDEQKKIFQKCINLIVQNNGKALLKVRKGDLISIAGANRIELAKTSIREDYINALLAWYHQEPKPTIKVPDVAQSEVPIKNPTPQPSPITTDVHSAIRLGISQITLPSWLERPPANFGVATHGKLKADHWRTICTVNLVITLGMLWGQFPEESWEWRNLQNFLDLVIAAEFASKRSMTKSRAETYEIHMLRYLQGLRKLYPHHNLSPNHHLSVHLAACLRLFGPVHSWWSFPFERYNGVMMCLNKNNKPGQMELTFFKTFCRGINLRHLVSCIRLPQIPEFQDWLQVIKDTFLSPIQGSIVGNMLAFVPDAPPAHGIVQPSSGTTFSFQPEKCTPLDDGIVAKLCHRLNQDLPRPYYALGNDMNSAMMPLPGQAQILRKIRISGDSFNGVNQRKSIGNSFVIFREAGNRSLQAGQIEFIFLHHRRHAISNVLGVEPFLVVQRYAPLSTEHQTLDPFRLFKNLSTWLCYHRSHDTLVLRATDIVSHFASDVYIPSGINELCIVVRSLDRT